MAGHLAPVMKFLEGTSVEDLSYEYVKWSKSTHYGTRFGQHFWNHYGCNDETWPELFYEESPHSAFLLIHGELSKQ